MGVDAGRDGGDERAGGERGESAATDGKRTTTARRPRERGTAGLLSGIRVLDCTDERGHLAGRILADLGADVLKVEPPGGDPARRLGPFQGGAPHPERGLRWRAMNAGKRSAVLDLESESGRRALLDRLRGTDVLLETWAPAWREAHGLSDAALHEREPGLVIASITPFGRSGPHADRPGHDLVVVARGGNMAMTGEPDRPPLRCSLPTSQFHAGPEAVVGVLLALWAREDTGRGQTVDVSMQECQVTTLLGGPGQLRLGGRPGRRTGARLGRTREIWAAKDGWVSFGLRGGPARVPNLEATVAWMAEQGAAPDWLRDFDWNDWDAQTADAGAIARVEDAFGAFFRTRTMRELYDESLRRRILLAPCNDGREILAHPQLRSRDLFVRVPGPEPGLDLELPGRFALWEGGGRIGLRGRAPRLGEHQGALAEPWHDDAERRPVSGAPAPPAEPGSLLRGLRILELGSGAAGPVVTRYFAEQGADVIRLESGLRPDFLRFLQPDGRAGLDRAPMFALLNADKRSLALDMKHPEARSVFDRLVDWADVVSENFAPGVLERWGVDVAALRARNPSLIVVRSCLFGQTGPQRHYPGFGGQGSAIAGFNHLTGYADAEAIGPYATITDSLSPRFVAAAVAAALWRRRRTGEGGVLDASQIEIGVYSLSEMIARESAGAEPARRQGNRSDHACPHGVYRCAGVDRWIAIAVCDDAAWRGLVREMAADGLAPGAEDEPPEARRARADALDERIAAWTADRSADALCERLLRAGVEAAPVADFADLLRDPQLAHRGHFVEVPHAELGPLPCERPGYRLSAAPGRIERAGPRLGEHTREVLRDALGLPESEIAALEAAEVLR